MNQICVRFLGNLEKLFSTERICLNINEDKKCVKLSDLIRFLKNLYPSLYEVLDDVIIIYNRSSLDKESEMCEAEEDIILVPLMSGG